MTGHKPVIKHAIVVALLFVVLILVQVATGSLQLGRLRVGGVDPGDLDFENEYRHFSPDFLGPGQRPKTATGHRPNPHGIGWHGHCSVSILRRRIPCSRG